VNYCTRDSGAKNMAPDRSSDPESHGQSNIVASLILRAYLPGTKRSLAMEGKIAQQGGPHLDQLNNSMKKLFYQQHLHQRYCISIKFG